MIRQTALVPLALLLGACPGESPNRNREQSVLLVDGPPRLDAPGGPADRGITLTDLKGKLDGKPKVDSKTVTPDQKPPPQADGWTGTDDIGKPCQLNSDCKFNWCATNTHTGVQFCTKTCDRCAATPCPTGSGCQNAGIAYICAPGYPNAPCP